MGRRKGVLCVKDQKLRYVINEKPLTTIVHVHHMLAHRMTTALFASATVLISYCVLLGKVSATQLVVMAMIELPLAQVNEYIGFHKLYVSTATTRCWL